MRPLLLLPLRLLLLQKMLGKLWDVLLLLLLMLLSLGLHVKLGTRCCCGCCCSPGSGGYFNATSLAFGCAFAAP